MASTTSCVELKISHEERKCGELPVVINFSSGILAGPRDGTQPIELAIDARIEVAEGKRRQPM